MHAGWCGWVQFEGVDDCLGMFCCVVWGPEMIVWGWAYCIIVHVGNSYGGVFDWCSFACTHSTFSCCFVIQLWFLSVHASAIQQLFWIGLGQQPRMILCLTAFVNYDVCISSLHQFCSLLLLSTRLTPFHALLLLCFCPAFYFGGGRRIFSAVLTDLFTAYYTLWEYKNWVQF